MIFTLSLLILQIAILYFFGFKLYTYYFKIPNSIAFFHPYSNAGGGGERVLWRAISTLQKNYKSWKIIVYSGDFKLSSSEIIKNSEEKFNIKINLENVQIVKLRMRNLIEPRAYFTMILQMFGGFWLGVEALLHFVPEIVIDTTGCPLIMPLFFYIGGIKTASYVHFPMINTDMIELVKSRKISYNNKTWITNKKFITQAKIFYYFDLTCLYKFCGSCINLTMCNGSWTKEHIMQLWNQKKSKTSIFKVVFPPCDVDHLLSLNNNAEQLFKDLKRVEILSVGQIRPEKNHEKQLKILAETRCLAKKFNLDCQIVLVIAGSCRNEEDFQRLENLKKISTEVYGFENNVDVLWKINISFTNLCKLFQNSMIGLHTMWNEHFGISVVEGIAAANIMIAHNSGGPKLDIIDKKMAETNLADTENEFAEKIINIIKMSTEERCKIRLEGRESIKRFSNEKFDKEFLMCVEKLMLL